MFEYLAAGKAVVGSVSGEAAQILREAGAVVVPPEDDAALAGAIRDLAADPERRLAMGQAGRRHVEQCLRPGRAGPRVPEDSRFSWSPAMRLLVTGGSGFLGGYVLTEAARRGHETVALARSDAAAVTVARRGGQPLTGDLDDPARLLAVFGAAHCEALGQPGVAGFCRPRRVMTGGDLALLARTAAHLQPGQIAQRARLRTQRAALRRFPATARWLLAGPDPATATGWPAGFTPLDAQLWRNWQGLPGLREGRIDLLGMTRTLAVAAARIRPRAAECGRTRRRQTGPSRTHPRCGGSTCITGTGRGG